MSSPKTYDGKFNRVKALIEQSHSVRSAVEAFARSNPEQDVFYNLNRLVYFEIKDALQETGMDVERQPTTGKSPKSAANMAFTLSGWLQSALFPETDNSFGLPDINELRIILTNYETYARQNHEAVCLDNRPMAEKLGLDLRTREEKLKRLRKKLTA